MIVVSLNRVKKHNTKIKTDSKIAANISLLSKNILMWFICKNRYKNRENLFTKLLQNRILNKSTNQTQSKQQTIYAKTP